MIQKNKNLILSKKENLSVNEKIVFSRWRELGGFYKIFYRLSSEGHIELKGKINLIDDLNLLCKNLAQRLNQEFEIQNKKQIQKINNVTKNNFNENSFLFNNQISKNKNLAPQVNYSNKKNIKNKKYVA